MQSMDIFISSRVGSASRRRSIGMKLTVASFALFAMSLASANAAPLHSYHHHTRGGYAGPGDALESPQTGGWTYEPPTYAWTSYRRKPVEIFGQKVDP
jgi:hypothetical protein